MANAHAQQITGSGATSYHDASEGVGVGGGGRASGVVHWVNTLQGHGEASMSAETGVGGAFAGGWVDAPETPNHCLASSGVGASAGGETSAGGGFGVGRACAQNMTTSGEGVGVAHDQTHVIASSMLDDIKAAIVSGTPSRGGGVGVSRDTARATVLSIIDNNNLGDRAELSRRGPSSGAGHGQVKALDVTLSCHHPLGVCCTHWPPTPPGPSMVGHRSWRGM